MTQQAEQATPVLFCRKVLGSFWACAKPGKTHQDRTGEKGQKWLYPGGKGKMISVPGTHKT